MTSNAIRVAKAKKAFQATGGAYMSFRLSDETIRRLDEMAFSRGVSRNEMLNRLLEGMK